MNSQPPGGSAEEEELDWLFASLGATLAMPAFGMPASSKESSVT